MTSMKPLDVDIVRVGFGTKNMVATTADSEPKNETVEVKFYTVELFRKWENDDGSIEENDNGALTARVQELPGCFSEGDTKDEAIDNITDAIYCYLS